MIRTKSLKEKAIYFFTLLIICAANAQNTSEKDVLSSFKDYTKIPREIAYVHINKSTFILGESMAFSAYVLDKNSKQLSTITTNLYCVLKDKNDKVVKSKLLKVEHGIASGDFAIDSLFSSGDYNFKAYTNWMRNFNELNHYEQTIKIIDPNTQESVFKKSITNNVDAQFLPEGGHLVADTKNTLGVVVKDNRGFGVSQVEGRILDKNDVEISNFKTNQFGLGKFVFIPERGNTYKAIMTVNNNEQKFELSPSENIGVTLTLNDLGSRVALTFNTNEATLNSIKGKPYKMTIHNGNKIKSVDIVFSEETSINRLINYVDLEKGVNVFTVFDELNKPILERLFFKHAGLEFLESGEVILKKDMDSIQVTIPIKNKDVGNFNNFSISVLPGDTESYKHHHNLPSYTLLQPYVNGYIENAAYYFREVTRKKKYELDILLITQGWSSYSWNKVFDQVPNSVYDFETGLSINAKVNQKNSGQYLIYPTAFSKSNILALSENETSFERTELFPLNDEKLKIGEIQSNGKTIKPKLYLRFTPSSIPLIKNEAKVLDLKHDDVLEYSEIPNMKAPWEVEELDAVVVTAEKEATRMEKIKRNERGRVDVFDDDKRMRYFDFASYISSQGFRVNQTAGRLTVINPSSPTPNNRTPLIYLDGMRLLDFNILSNYRLEEVDYIVVDKSGLGEGIRGSAGVIKVFTDPSIRLTRRYGKVYQEYDVPLTFSAAKRFYTPVYTSFQTDFFREYGVLNWVEGLKVNANGNLQFSIPGTMQTKIKLFIEGMTDKGQFMSEIISVPSGL